MSPIYSLALKYMWGDPDSAKCSDRFMALKSFAAVSLVT